jgi:hypothetical protein
MSYLSEAKGLLFISMLKRSAETAELLDEGPRDSGAPGPNHLNR